LYAGVFNFSVFSTANSDQQRREPLFMQHKNIEGRRENYSLRLQSCPLDYASMSSKQLR
jgi:hypothetical protein